MITMELRDRLSLWREVILAKPQEEDGAITAGRKAEEFLHQLIKNNIAFKGGYAFAGKRIPHPTERRRYEVDMMVLTNKKLHIIEVKNWSGDVFVNEAGNWVQSRRSGEHVEHPPLTKYNAEKSQALVKYLAAHGVDVPEDFISQRVLFMNRNLGLSAAIEEDPNVIPAGRLYRYVGGMRGETWAEGVMRALIRVCLDDDNGRIVLDGLYRSIPTEDKRKVAAVLSELDTWDRLDLHGGRQLQGDARAIIVDGEKIPLEDFPSDIHLKWNRNPITSLLTALAGSIPSTKIGLSGTNYEIYPGRDGVLFHAAGDPKPKLIDLRFVDRITSGRQPSVGHKRSVLGIIPTLLRGLGYVLYPRFRPSRKSGMASGTGLIGLVVFVLSFTAAKNLGPDFYPLAGAFLLVALYYFGLSVVQWVIANTIRRPKATRW